MSTITIRTTDKEKELIKELASFNGRSISDFVKSTILEKIGDEYDYRIAEEAIPFDELLNKHGIK